MTQTVKRISGSYLVESANISVPLAYTIGSAVSDNAVVTINGNLIVSGTQTTINTTDLAVTDNIIALNLGGFAGNVGTSGIEVDRGVSPNVSVLWNEATQHWTLTNDGSTFSNIATTSVGDHFISSVVEDTDPHLGGNLVTGHGNLQFNITSLTNTNLILNPDLYLQVDKPIQLAHVTPPPTSVVGYTLVHGGNVAGGASGVYITSEVEINQELIAKRRAIVYSLIF